jgi:hypothetical protein
MTWLGSASPDDRAEAKLPVPASAATEIPSFFNPRTALVDPGNVKVVNARASKVLDACLFDGQHALIDTKQLYLLLRKSFYHFQVFLDPLFVDPCQTGRFAERLDMIHDCFQRKVDVIAFSNCPVLCTVSSSGGFWGFVLANGAREPLLL